MKLSTFREKSSIFFHHTNTANRNLQNNFILLKITIKILLLNNSTPVKFKDLSFETKTKKLATYNHSFASKVASLSTIARYIYIYIFIYPPPPFRFIHVVESRELVKHPGPVKPIVEERRGVTSAFITICKGEVLRAAYREEICQ